MQYEVSRSEAKVRRVSNSMLLLLMFLAKTYNNGSKFVTVVCKTLLMIYLSGFYVQRLL